MNQALLPATGAAAPTRAWLVAVETPQHSGLEGLLAYTSEQALAPGTLLQVPLGRRVVTGVVWQALGGGGEGVAGQGTSGQGAAGQGGGGGGDGDDGASARAAAELLTSQLRPVGPALASLPALDDHWRALVAFCARYYQRSIGEVALAVLPPLLRQPDDALTRRLNRWRAEEESRAPAPPTQTSPSSPAVASPVPPTLSAAQAEAVHGIASRGAGTTLLHGVTGSGKTEVYLQLVQQVIEHGGQALVMVPEINLTPQLEARFAERFAGQRIVSLHSGLTPVQRLRAWWLAQRGLASIVLGTRLAIFTPLPLLALVVVDEEHDPSFKQQDGARYSARDLAVWRGRHEGVPVLLGSATPSLESWQQALLGRYHLATLPARIADAAMPQVQLVDMGRVPRPTANAAAPVLAPALLLAMQQRLARGEQSLVLLNRRGYAPVLHCGACGWKSDCPHCSAWRVFHKSDRTLRCHHCGVSDRVPRGCPDCGNLDLAPIGRGTEKLEEQLGELLPGARIARIDADSSRGQGVLTQQLAAVHAGEVDVLVGTQMVTKGHDFRRITLVAAVNPDGALFSSDFRAPERLFALLMQAGGRAGRDAQGGGGSQMWVQTWHPTHPLYAALLAHDYERFASAQLEERRTSGLPPFSHLALLRADAVLAEVAEAFLRQASAVAAGMPESAPVTLYPVVPLPVQRVAGVERMQMLVESASRQALQRFLAAWLPQLHALRPGHKRVKRWAVDVDPLSV